MFRGGVSCLLPLPWDRTKSDTQVCVVNRQEETPDGTHNELLKEKTINGRGNPKGISYLMLLNYSLNFNLSPCIV